MAESDHSVKSLLEEVLVPEWSDGGSDIEIIQENVTRSSVNKNQKRRLKRTFPQSKKKNTVPNLQSVTDDSYTSVCGIKVSIKSLLQNEEIRKQIAPFIEKQIIIPNWSDSSDPEEVQKNRSTKSSSRKGRNKLKRPKQVNKPLTDHTYFVNKETSESITSTIEEGIVPEFLNITEIENIASMNIAVTEESGGSQNLPPYVEEEIIISNLPIDCSTSEVEQSVNENLQNTKENDLDIQESHITKNVEILDLVDSSDDEVVDKINTTDTRTVTEDRKNKSKLITNKTDHDQLVESDKTSDYYKCNYENFTVDENLFLANALENQKAAESSTIKTVDDQNLSLLDSDDWYYLNMSNVPNDKVELNKSKNVKVKPRKQTGRCKKKIGTKFRKNKDKIQLQGRIVKRSVKNTKTNVQNINSEPNLVSEESVIPDPLSLENATKEIKIDINENSSCETDIVSVIKEETILPDFVVTEATEDSKKNIANGELAFINTNNTSGNTQNNSRGLTLKPIIKSEEIAINFNKISEVTYENVSNETNTKMVPDMGWGKSDDENVEDFSNEQRKHSLKRKMKKSTLLTEWSIKTRNKKVKLLPELTMKTRNKKVKLLPELTMKTRSKKRKRLPELTMKTRNKKLTLLPELTKKTRNKKLKLVPELTMKTRKGKVKSIAESNIARTLHSEKKQRSYLGECSKCGKKYQKIGLLRIHESTCVRMQKEEIFKCVMCSYKTKGKDAFRNHLGNHILGTGYSKISSDNTIPVQKSVNLKLETEECGQVQEGCLPNYLITRCTSCHKVTAAKSHPTKCRLCQGQLFYCCALCSERFGTFWLLRRHVQSALRISPEEACNKCGIAGHLSTCQLKKHVSICRIREAVETSRSMPMLASTMMPYVRLLRCEWLLSSLAGLGRQYLLQSYCPKCKLKKIAFLRKKTCDDCGSLLFYKCKICNTTVISYSSLCAHLMDNHATDPHQCIKCGKVYGQMWHLRLHKKLCDSAKLTHCEYCSYTSNYKDDFIKHVEKQHLNKESISSGRRLPNTVKKLTNVSSTKTDKKTIKNKKYKQCPKTNGQSKENDLQLTETNKELTENVRESPKTDRKSTKNILQFSDKKSIKNVDLSLKADTQFIENDLQSSEIDSTSTEDIKQTAENIRQSFEFYNKAAENDSLGITEQLNCNDRIIISMNPDLIESNINNITTSTEEIIEASSSQLITNSSGSQDGTIIKLALESSDFDVLKERECISPDTISAGSPYYIESTTDLESETEPDKCS